MKHYLSSLLLLIISYSYLSAEIAVKSFRKLESDMTARIDAPRLDQNGKTCAIIKVVTTQKDFVWEPDALGIVTVEPKVGEYWLYVPWGAKRLTIKHPQLGVMRDYLYPLSIEQATVYEMVLVTGRVTTIVEETIESQWLVITPEPSDASVYIDDVYINKGIYQAKLKPGSYTYRVEAPLYHAQVGVIQISNKKEELKVQLKPNFGHIRISSLPESDAQVLIDDKPLNTLTPATSGALKSGDYTVKVIKEMYQPFVKKVTVNDEKTTTVEALLQPNFAELTVNVPAGASIYLNNQLKNTGSWKGRLPAGIFTVEARLGKHKDARQDIELKIGENRTLNLNPTPIYGSLDVITNPPGATITIDGKSYGTTPNTINRLLIGDYTVQLSRQGYASVTKSIIITEGTSAMINETLIDGREVTINSTPSGVNLYVDGTAVGKTPYKGILTFGGHVLKIENEGKSAEKTVAVKELGGESVFVIEIVTVPTVYNPKTGKTWMDRNLGASRVATSSTDGQAYGDLYQWGRGSDGHEKRTSQTTSTLSRSDTPGHGNFITVSSGNLDWRSPRNNNLWQGVNGTNNPCPEGFRIPTYAEWNAERASWSNNNSEGAFASPLKLPVAGYRGYSSGSLLYVGSYGYYWSSAVDGTSSRFLYFGSSNASVSSVIRAYGYSVRCLKD